MHMLLGKWQELVSLNPYIGVFVKGLLTFDMKPLQYKKLPIPPVEEQEAIVEFLDSKTLKIDSYVAERERELAALEELRQAR